MKEAFNREIFKEMILYIAGRCQDKPAFNSDRLNKVLYYSDFLWYGYTGEAMSHETYTRESNGPIAAHLAEVCKELEAEAKLKFDERNGFGKVEKRPIVTISPDFELLTNEQEKFIAQIIEASSGYNASEVSNLIAHQDMSWHYLRNGEAIPYETVFFRRKNPISEDTMRWAKSVINEYEESLRGEESVV
jgi:hypothetical protein